MHLFADDPLCGWGGRDVFVCVSWPPGVFLHPGHCWTLHSWEDSPAVGQIKVPGSLWADPGSVSVPAQVKTHFIIPAIPLPTFWTFSLKCNLKYFFKNLSLFHFYFSPFRNKIALESTQALFLLVAEKSMSCMSSSMGEVYSHHRDTDGFLYITYASQEIFGAPLPAARPPCWKQRSWQSTPHLTSRWHLNWESRKKVKRSWCSCPGSVVPNCNQFQCMISFLILSSATPDWWTWCGQWIHHCFVFFYIVPQYRQKGFCSLSHQNFKNPEKAVVKKMTATDNNVNVPKCVMLVIYRLLSTYVPFNQKKKDCFLKIFVFPLKMWNFDSGGTRWKHGCQYDVSLVLTCFMLSSSFGNKINLCPFKVWLCVIYYQPIYVLFGNKQYFYCKPSGLFKSVQFCFFFLPQMCQSCNVKQEHHFLSLMAQKLLTSGWKCLGARAPTGASFLTCLQRCTTPSTWRRYIRSDRVN